MMRFLKALLEPEDSVSFPVDQDVQDGVISLFLLIASALILAAALVVYASTP
jgi:hypothetical protein